MRTNEESYFYLNNDNQLVIALMVPLSIYDIGDFENLQSGPQEALHWVNVKCFDQS